MNRLGYYYQKVYRRTARRQSDRSWLLGPQEPAGWEPVEFIPGVVNGFVCEMRWGGATPENTSAGGCDGVVRWQPPADIWRLSDLWDGNLSGTSVTTAKQPEAHTEPLDSLLSHHAPPAVALS